jgi:hypothetical protein
VYHAHKLTLSLVAWEEDGDSMGKIHQKLVNFNDAVKKENTLV